jgi:hypothetical protein
MKDTLATMVWAVFFQVLPQVFADCAQRLCETIPDEPLTVPQCFVDDATLEIERALKVHMVLTGDRLSTAIIVCDRMAWYIGRVLSRYDEPTLTRIIAEAGMGPHVVSRPVIH